MAGDAKLEMLKRVPLFERLGKGDLARLGRLTDEVEVPADRVLMREGETGSEMFVIESGRVRVERAGGPTRELGSGDWFGEMALVTHAPRTATVTTIEPSRMFVVAHREFHSLMDELPSVRTSVLDCLADRVRKVEPEIA